MIFHDQERQVAKKKWYILYVCPRAEKIAYRQLTEKNYEVFFPTIKTLKEWKNRQKKESEVPLFRSYIFVHTCDYELYNIKKLPKVVTYIHCGGKPSSISDEEIEGIRKMLKYEKNIVVENRFFEGERVKVIEGPLTGRTGTLIKQKGKARFGIQLQAINHTVLADIQISSLEKI